jgi:hypothetical protein
MCCFSQPVISVSSTNIFARSGPEGRQFLVYSMAINAAKDLAMILPLPVKTPASEKDVEFVDLKGYPNFFSELDRGFLRPPPPSASKWFATSETASARKLEVVQVGDFEASFVPTAKDFSRIDERFRLPSDTWNKLSDYQTYGFAVFKLKRGSRTIHPMAFSFRRQNPQSLFFPTVHIHDGKVHADADFDHAIYCQPTDDGHPAVFEWQESSGHARSFVDVKKTKGIILADQHCYKKEMRGYLPNRDTFLEVHV